MNYHFLGEKRRSTTERTYFPNLCQDINSCRLGDRCSKSHNIIESLYHPQIYQTFACPFELPNKKCYMGTQCYFLHNRPVPRSKEQKDNEINLKDLEAKQKELLELETKTKGKCKCGRAYKKYVVIPCGHLICENCNIKPTCVQCGSKGESYLIR